MSRKAAIAAIVAATASTAIAADAQSPAAPSLESAAAATGRFFGAAVRDVQLAGEPDLRAAVLRECGYIVPEIDLNWNVVEPAAGQLSFAKMDDFAAFATAHKKKVRGHELLWHLAVPDWASEALRERQDWNVIARYFGSIIPRYGDVIQQWEVVNEPIDVGHRPDGLRQSVLLDAFGPDYIPRALEQARIFAPRAYLLINEFGLEYDIPEERDRRYCLLKLLERLRAAKAPLDGLGLQGHLNLAKGHVSQKALTAFLRDVTQLGLTMIVTELDVKEANYAAPPSERDRLVADETRRYLDIVLSARGVLGVTTWGLSDRQSWLQVTPEDYARFPGAWTDGTNPGFNRGLPFDSSMHPMPMYFALRDALSSVEPRYHKV